MKIYYYTFTPKGEVVKDIVSGRKSKNFVSIEANTKYGGMMHLSPSKLYFKYENKLMGADSEAINGCHFFSSEISEITDEMKEFATKRANKIQQIIKIREECRGMAGEFSLK